MTVALWVLAGIVIGLLIPPVIMFIDYLRNGSSIG